MSGRFDEVAKTLVTPMPRRRALGLVAGALGLAALDALRPGRARADAIACPPGTPPCGSTGTTSFCCDPLSGQVCCPGASGNGVCCDVGAGGSCCSDSTGPFCCPPGSLCQNPGTTYPCNPPCSQGSTPCGIVNQFPTPGAELCCPPNTVCCRAPAPAPVGNCCPPNSTCNPDGSCACPSGTTACGVTATGGAATCCPASHLCCGNDCCPPSRSCCAFVDSSGTAQTQCCKRHQTCDPAQGCV